MTTPAPSAYPVQFSVEYPDRELNRLSSLFRIIAIIPIGIVFVLIGRYAWGENNESAAIGAGLFLAPLLMIVFRQKYPKWWFDYIFGLMKFESRVMAYLFLLRDEYPSTDEEQTVHLEVPYPDVQKDLNRWLPIVKWLLAIPHYIVMFFLFIATVIVVIVTWFIILFTGRYPRDLFDFVVGTMRYANRVWAYAFLLSTDKYPPFRLSA
jgi:small-conductance mechanosensitive channel